MQRSSALAKQGVFITRFSIRVTSNRIGIGVKGVTAEAAQFLINEFGADGIGVFEVRSFVRQQRSRNWRANQFRERDRVARWDSVLQAVRDVFNPSARQKSAP